VVDAQRTQSWWWDGVWLLVWAAASAVWCITAAQQLSATFDEPFYVASGLEGWRTGSHATLLRKGTMPLSADLQALPLYLWERWNGVPFDPQADLHRLLPWARAATLVFWGLVLLYGMLAARHIGGVWAGRLAVALLACEPSLLAHASLATTDVAVSACLLGLAYHFRVARQTGWPRRVAVPAAWYAAALLAKASALLIGPLWLLVVEIERLGRAAAAPRGRWPHLPPGVVWRAFARDCGWIVSIGLLIVFLYCGSDWRPEPSFVAWAHGLRDAPLAGSMVWLAEHLRIFSNAGEGVVRQITHNIRGHGAYVLGHTDARALWYYFPVVFTIKLSEPVLLAPLLVAAVRPRTLVNWACLAAAAVILFSVTFRVQLGVRMILPAVVLLIVGLSAAAANAGRDLGPRWRTAVVAVAVSAVVWTGFTTLSVWPHGLAYVNRFWGGTWKGYALVTDSNYDWGQGLFELRRWVRDRDLGALDVWYFGKDPGVEEPPLRHLPLHRLPLHTAADVEAAIDGRCLAVSTTILYGVDPRLESYRVAATFLRARQPDARTTTFFLYDFTRRTGVASFAQCGSAGS